jgi:hypothetical protein
LGDEADNDDWRQRPEDVMPAIRSASVAETFPAARAACAIHIELSFWESVRESDNPASLKAYLEKDPDGLRRNSPERTRRAAHIGPLLQPFPAEPVSIHPIWPRKSHLILPRPL